MGTNNALLRPSVRPAAFSRPRGPANVQTDRRRPPDSSPRLRGLPLGHSASHRPIPDPSRYGAGLKEVGAPSLALISNVGYVDLEKWSHWPRLRRGEQRPHKEMGEERGEGGRAGRLNPAKRHMARAPTPTMLAAITTWKKCSTMIGGERAGRPRGPWGMMISHLSPFAKIAKRRSSKRIRLKGNGRCGRCGILSCVGCMIK